MWWERYARIVRVRFITLLSHTIKERITNTGENSITSMAKIHTVIWTLIPFDNLSPQALCRQIIINSSARSWTRNFSFSCKRHSTFTRALTVANIPCGQSCLFSPSEWVCFHWALWGLEPLAEVRTMQAEGSVASY